MVPQVVLASLLCIFEQITAKGTFELLCFWRYLFLAFAREVMFMPLIVVVKLLVTDGAQELCSPCRGSWLLDVFQIMRVPVFLPVEHLLAQGAVERFWTRLAHQFKKRRIFEDILCIRLLTLGTWHGEPGILVRLFD